MDYDRFMDRPALEEKARLDSTSMVRLARLIRSYILKMTSAAGSGHMTSSLSSVELATMLFFKYFREGDHLIFSKGHATPLFYALYAAAGKISEQDLMKYRTFDSILEGHPTPRFAYTEAATGSLGQGLSVGAGEALAAKMIYEVGIMNYEKQKQNLNSKIINHTSIPRVFVLLGDGELAEGSVWEAASFAGQRKLNNLIAIVDVNRLGQSQATAYEYHTEIYQRRFDAFGWSTLVINGHDYTEINAAYEKAIRHQDGPIAIIGKTIKGKGVSFLENKNGWHGKALSAADLEKALKEVGV